MSGVPSIPSLSIAAVEPTVEFRGSAVHPGSEGQEIGKKTKK